MCIDSNQKKLSAANNRFHGPGNSIRPENGKQFGFSSGENITPDFP